MAKGWHDMWWRVMRGVVMLRRNIGIVLGRVVCLGHVGCYRGVSVMLWRVCVIVVVGILLGVWCRNG